MFDVPELFPQVIAELNIQKSVELEIYFENKYVGRSLPGGGQVATIFPLTFGITAVMLLMAFLVQLMLWRDGTNDIQLQLVAIIGNLLVI